MRKEIKVTFAVIVGLLLLFIGFIFYVSNNPFNRFVNEIIPGEQRGLQENVQFSPGDPYFNLAVCYEGEMGSYATSAKFGYFARDLVTGNVEMNKVTPIGNVNPEGISVESNSERVWSSNSYSLGASNIVWSLRIDGIVKTATIANLGHANSIVTTSNQCKFCGNGILDGNEECDDGNMVDDANGCAADCKVSDTDDYCQNSCYFSSVHDDSTLWSSIADVKFLGYTSDNHCSGPSGDPSFIACEPESDSGLDSKGLPVIGSETDNSNEPYLYYHCCKLSCSLNAPDVTISVDGQDVTCSVDTTNSNLVDGQDYRLEISLYDGPTLIDIYDENFTEDSSLADVFENTFVGNFDENSGALNCYANIVNADDDSCFAEAYSDYLYDIDSDGYLTENQQVSLEDDSVPFSNIPNYGQYDVDDWPLDDVQNPSATCLNDMGKVKDLNINSKILDEKKNYCYTDSDNDGIGENASCSYCRNPGMPEVADDIDNNGLGLSQGLNDTNGDGKYEEGVDSRRECIVEGYTGDGAETGDLVGFGSSFGGEDKFCQMVDENVSVNGNSCEGYSRAVTQGYFIEFDGLEQVLCNPSDQCSENRAYKVHIFRPSGINVSIKIDLVDEKTGKKDTAEINSRDSLCGFYLISTSWYWGLDEQGYRVELPAGKISRISQVSGCLDNLLENIGEIRGTSKNTLNFPLQFIDSVRGELDFDNFWSIVSSAGKSDGLTWKIVCTQKDKCADGGSNSIASDILNTLPYNFYLSSPNSVIFNGQNIGMVNEPFDVRLADVDNPVCKFSANLKSFSPAIDDYPDFSWPKDYLKRPYSNDVVPYCLDKDGDGFCGEALKLSPDSQSNNPWSINYKTVVDEEENKKYVGSAKFPDCDDDPFYDGRYKIGIPIGSKNPTRYGDIPLKGWLVKPLDVSRQIYTTWAVHPFSPVSLKNCNLGGYDMNCNKDGKEGYNFAQLRLQGTPFDSDLSTGVENGIVSWTRANGDFQCTSTSSAKIFLDSLASHIGGFIGRNVNTQTALMIGAVVGANVLVPGSGMALGVILFTSGAAQTGHALGSEFVKPNGEFKDSAQLDVDKIAQRSQDLFALLIMGKLADARIVIKGNTLTIEPFANSGSVSDKLAQETRSNAENPSVPKTNSDLANQLRLKELREIETAAEVRKIEAASEGSMDPRLVEAANKKIKEVVKNAKVDDSYLRDVKSNGHILESWDYVMKDRLTDMTFGSINIYVDTLSADLNIKLGHVNIGVKQGFKGSGAGRTLMNKAFEVFRKQNVREGKSFLIDDNLVEFIKLYDKFKQTMSEQDAAFAAAREFPTGKVWIENGFEPGSVKVDYVNAVIGHEVNIAWDYKGKANGGILCDDVCAQKLDFELAPFTLQGGSK